MVGETPCAVVPHHITGFFKPVYSTSPENTGSVGAGIAVYPPFRACYYPGHRRPGSRGPVTSTARRVLEMLGATDMEQGIWHSSPLPPGVGYAVSAASSIAYSLLASYLGRTTIGGALLAAHKSELLESTGLGDVLAISCGVGLVVRTLPGAPGFGERDCVPLPGSISVISVETGTMETRNLISLSTRASKLAEEGVKRLSEDPDLLLFLDYSRRFSEEIGLYSPIKERLDLETITGGEGVIGHFVKKRTLVIVLESSYIGEVLSRLEKGYTKLRLLRPSGSPPHIDYL